MRFLFIMAETSYQIAFKKAMHSISIVLCDELIEICDKKLKKKKTKILTIDWMNKKKYGDSETIN